MFAPSLIIANTTPPRPLWEIGGNYYRSLRLTQTDESFNNVLYRFTTDLSQLTSQPIVVRTQGGWVLLVTDGDTIVVKEESSPGVIRQPTDYLSTINVPDVSEYGQRLPSLLRPVDLPPFNPNLERQLRNIV